jgi:hypothetical protein
VQMTYNFSNVTIKTDPEARVSKTSDIAADWVDQALPSGAKVAAVPGVLDNFGRTRVIWWDVEFWNKSVDRVYDYEPAWLDTPYATQRLRLNWRTGALAVDRPAEYLVVPRYDRRFRPAGRPLARTDALELIEAKQPLSAAWAIRGTDSDGWTGPRAPAYIHLFASGAGEATRMRATVELTSASTIRQRFAIEGGERRVRGRAARKGRRHVVVPVCVDPTSGARLVLRVRDVIQLPSGKPAGLAITRVRTAPAGRCGSRA